MQKHNISLSDEELLAVYSCLDYCSEQLWTVWPRNTKKIPKEYLLIKRIQSTLEEPQSKLLEEAESLGKQLISPTPVIDKIHENCLESFEKLTAIMEFEIDPSAAQFAPFEPKE
jgi:hypothetical protein